MKDIEREIARYDVRIGYLPKLSKTCAELGQSYKLTPARYPYAGYIGVVILRRLQ